MAFLSAATKPTSTQRAATDTCRAFLLASSVFSIFQTTRKPRPHTRPLNSHHMGRGMMEEMLKGGDFAGLAVLCEQEELEVSAVAG